MRWALVALISCGIAGAQQQPSLIHFLALTTAETASVRQVNDAFMQFSNLKNQRLNAIPNELSAEYAEASSNPYALGVRYIKIDSIIHELAGEQTNVQAKVTALLTPAQIALVKQIALSVTQSNLAADASCGYLADKLPNLSNLPTFDGGKVCIRSQLTVGCSGRRVVSGKLPSAISYPQ